MKIRANNSKSAFLCWDPPSEKAGEAGGYEIDWSIDHVKQNILDIKQSHCHAFPDLKPKAIIVAAVRAFFNTSYFDAHRYTSPFSETMRLMMPDKKTD